MRSERSYKANLPLESIKSWLYTREQIDESKLGETMENIKKNGVIEPIIVREAGQGFEGVAGYLRYLASQKADLTTIPALVYEKLEDLAAMDILVIENLHRQEFSSLDWANVFNTYLQKGYKQKDIALRFDASPTFISLHLQLLKDKAPLRKAISEGKVTEAQARMVRTLPNSRALKYVIPKVEGKTFKETKEIVTEAQAKYVKDSLKEQIKELKEKIKAIAQYEKQRDDLQNDIDKLSGQLKALKTDNKEVNRNIKKIMQALRQDSRLLPSEQGRTRSLGRKIREWTHHHLAAP